MPKGMPHAPGNSTDSRYSAFARLSVMRPELDAWVIYCQVFGHDYDAGNVPTWLRANASKYFKHPEVQKWVQHYQGLLVEEFKVTAKELYDKLEVLYETSLGGERPQVSAGVAAVMGQAKLFGLDKQVIDHTSSDGSMSPTRRAAEMTDDELAALLDADEK